MSRRSFTVDEAAVRWRVSLEVAQTILLEFSEQGFVLAIPRDPERFVVTDAGLAVAHAMGDLLPTEAS